MNATRYQFFPWLIKLVIVTNVTQRVVYAWILNARAYYPSVYGTSWRVKGGNGNFEAHSQRYFPSYPNVSRGKRSKTKNVRNNEEERRNARKRSRPEFRRFNAEPSPAVSFADKNTRFHLWNASKRNTQRFLVYLQLTFFFKIIYLMILILMLITKCVFTWLFKSKMFICSFNT